MIKTSEPFVPVDLRGQGLLVAEDDDFIADEIYSRRDRRSSSERSP